jgi:hypothetical protein
MNLQAVIDPINITIVGFVPEGAYLTGPWTGFVSLPFPQDMNQETLGVTKNGNEYVFIIDPDKVAAKTAQAWSQIRQQRNTLLTQSDWTVTAPDLPESILDKRVQWLEYRQALRDITKNTTDPTQIEWPQVPAN